MILPLRVLPIPLQVAQMPMVRLSELEDSEFFAFRVMTVRSAAVIHNVSMGSSSTK